MKRGKQGKQRLWGSRGVGRLPAAPVSPVIGRLGRRGAGGGQENEVTAHRHHGRDSQRGPGKRGGPTDGGGLPRRIKLQVVQSLRLSRWHVSRRALPAVGALRRSSSGVSASERERSSPYATEGVIRVSEGFCRSCSCMAVASRKSQPGLQCSFVSAPA